MNMLCIAYAQFTPYQHTKSGYPCVFILNHVWGKSADLHDPHPSKPCGYAVN